MTKRLLAVFLTIIMTVSLASCKKGNNGSNLQKSNSDTKLNDNKVTVNLLYNKTDTFNPYTAKTENNKNICKLIFEPLVKTDNSFNPVLRLASNVAMNGKTCDVTIKDAVFSDGTPVSANDVAYSYSLAKNSGGIYASHLYEVISVSVKDSKTLSFNLSRIDPFFENLIDFPIIKSGSDTISNSDGVLIPPIGCGRYTVNDEKTELILNKSFFGEKGAISKISLINAPDEDSLSHYVEIGAAELYYNDLSDGKIARMSGKRAEVNLNNLIFIGVNSSVGGLSSKNLRYAISSAIDRNTICNDTLYNNAVPATGYFNPKLKSVEAIQSIKKDADIEITVENLKKIGYNGKDSNGYYSDASGKHRTFSLLVNSENRSRVLVANQIASQLKTAGIDVKVVEKKYSEYVASLSSGSFELYLGEVSILPNFDMSPLVLPGGAMSFGVASPTANTDENENHDEEKAEEATEVSSTIPAVLEGYYSGKNSISDVAGVLLTELVQIPIAYRKGLFFYKDNIVSDVEATESDIYFSIEKYKFK